MRSLSVTPWGLDTLIHAMIDGMGAPFAEQYSWFTNVLSALRELNSLMSAPCYKVWPTWIDRSFEEKRSSANWRRAYYSRRELSLPGWVKLGDPEAKAEFGVQGL